MCMVSINVDEAALRDMRPELDSTAAIRNWAQELINLRIQQMKLENTETMSIEDARAATRQAVSREYALERDLTPEELYAVIMEDAKAIYADDSI